MLSKLTTQSLGTWSSAAVNSSSDTSPLRVRVSAATTTAPIRSATGFLVSISTGRSPPGVAANQSSPRRIGPVGPILRGPPFSYLSECLLVVRHGQFGVGLDVVVGRELSQVAPQCIANQLRSVNAQTPRPRLNVRYVRIIDAKANHRHTFTLACMTGLAT